MYAGRSPSTNLKRNIFFMTKKTFSHHVCGNNYNRRTCIGRTPSTHLKRNIFWTAKTTYSGDVCGNNYYGSTCIGRSPITHLYKADTARQTWGDVVVVLGSLLNYPLPRKCSEHNSVGEGGGLHSSEEAFTLLTQPWVWFLAFPKIFFRCYQDLSKGTG